MTLTAAPSPGIYERIPFEEYLSWDAISNSRINLARHSLAHYKQNNPLKPTAAIRLGSLVHCGRLEPMALAKRYAVMPRFENDPENRTAKGEIPARPKTTRYYELKAAEFAQANPDKEIVTDEQYDEMVAIVESLSRHHQAKAYLEAPGPVELSLVWNDPLTGLLCKARIDKFVPDLKLICDLKTYTPQQGYATPADKFTRSIVAFGYHRQMAHYRNGMRVLANIECDTALAVVENAKPYCPMAAPMSEEWLSIGRQEVKETLEQIAKAHITNQWPGFDSPAMWFPPTWYGSVELVINGQTVEI